MIVDLAEKEVTGTFELDGGGKVHLRLLTMTDLREIRKACITTAVEYPKLDGKFQRFEAETFDGEKWAQMYRDRNIIDWEDLFDRDKNPIPVTSENRALLLERVPAFREAVEAGNKALKEGEAAKVGAAEKN